MKLAKFWNLSCALFSLVLPKVMKPRFLGFTLGYDIHPTASIGMSIICADSVHIGPHVKIGHFNVLRSLSDVRMGEGAKIGRWNWITAAPEFRAVSDLKKPGRLDLAENAVVTSRHYLDCSGGIALGRFALVAGVRSTVFSHQIDVVSSRQTAAEVVIGDYCLVGSNAKILPGVNIAPNSQIAMGSVVNKSIEEPGYLWAGVPVSRKRRTGGAWFERCEERVDVR